jgi:hypothetical protein
MNTLYTTIIAYSLSTAHATNDTPFQIQQAAIEFKSYETTFDM